jgi:type 1 glutamine amidotransferase
MIAVAVLIFPALLGFCAGFELPTLVAAESSKPHVVMLVAENEYQTQTTLPLFAQHHLQAYRTTFVFAEPQDDNRLVGIEAVELADVLLISVRRRTLPPEQLDVIRRYVAAGKPVIGIRTASHAFCLRQQDPPPGRAAWPEFDRQVFGGNYTNHHGNSLQATVSLEDQVLQRSPRLLRGLESTGPFAAGGSLYRVSPLADGSVVLLIGRVHSASPEPVAWTYRRADGGKSFYTSLGHADDFGGEFLPRLLVNALEWSTEE